MKKELMIVASLLLLVSFLAITNNLSPANQITGNFVIDFQKENIDYFFNQYGNIFEFTPGDGVILTNSLGNEYIITYLKSDTDQFGFSSKLMTEHAVLSIERAIRGDKDLKPYKIKVGKVDSIRGLNVFVYVASIFDIEGIDNDSAIVSFPNAASFIYRPRMTKGETRIVNGHKVELIDYYYDEALISRGYAVVKVDEQEVKLRNYSKPTNVKGLKIGVSEMEKVKSVKFTILDVNNVQLEESVTLQKDPRVEYSVLGYD